jgi:hypothetical protein
VSFLFVRSFVLSLSWQIVEFHEEGIGWVLLSPAAAGRPSFGPAKNPFMSASLIFVPSLSWQIISFFNKQENGFKAGVSIHLHTKSE